MAVQPWAIDQLSTLLPLDESELRQILSYSLTLSNTESAHHLQDLLGTSDDALRFISAFNQDRMNLSAEKRPAVVAGDIKSDKDTASKASKQADHMQPHGSSVSQLANNAPTVKTKNDINRVIAPPAYAPPSESQSISNRSKSHSHTNPVIEAAKIRARDEQEMQQELQRLQYAYGIYNADIEPEHDIDYPCDCAVHRYQRRKWRRYEVQKMWSNAVMYPGEKAYDDSYQNPRAISIFSSNPYRFKVVSPYGYFQASPMNISVPNRPVASYHAQAIHQTIRLNQDLNQEAQVKIDSREPKHSIWTDDAMVAAMGSLIVGGEKGRDQKPTKPEYPNEKGQDPGGRASAVSASESTHRPKTSKLSSFRKSLGLKSSEEKSILKAQNSADQGQTLRSQIETEETSRWPDSQWRHIVAIYQEKVGMSAMISDLRARKPIQYLHLLRAGYFEPIPVAWANQASNPLKFSIEAQAGWRGITPAWRGYEDTAEERLYWALNHREGSVGKRMKPDFISEMNMARARMATAVDPPPLYFDAGDQCHVQHTSEGYSKQVMPAPFRPADRPEVPADDTMILLDVSGSMDFEPVRPVYEQYLVRQWVRSMQPKNKDVAKAIIRRFTDAMAHHDHSSTGYDLVTFSDRATVIGTVTHRNLDSMWRSVRLGGGTRVMTGWQKVKDLHFQKHSQSATYHPVYGWQAGPETPILRLLLLLDGEATDMDEFELDLLGLSWAHVTIFLIGVDGCPHHHRHANELQRISDVNHHVSFVDAQGNCPERFVTHELLKRHLGYEVSMQEFEEMEELPAYEE